MAGYGSSLGRLSHLTTDRSTPGQKAFVKPPEGTRPAMHSTMRFHERSRDFARPSASTFNPKVAGSIPARPIRRERIRDAQRPTTQSAREIAKTGPARRIPKSRRYRGRRKRGWMWATPNSTAPGAVWVNNGSTAAITEAAPPRGCPISERRPAVPAGDPSLARSRAPLERPVQASIEPPESAGRGARLLSVMVWLPAGDRSWGMDL
jgi:hypothetical protein